MGCRIFLFAFSAMVLLGGCATDSIPAATEPHVQLGMTREDLKSNFGEPERIEPVAGGRENWFYRFSAPKVEQQNSTETTQDFDGKTTISSVSWNFSQGTEERPVHLSVEGFVIKPLPHGKLIKE